MISLCPICKKSVTQEMSTTHDYRTDFIPTHLACFAKAWDNDPEPETPVEPMPEEPDDDGIVEEPVGV